MWRPARYRVCKGDYLLCPPEAKNQKILPRNLYTGLRFPATFVYPYIISTHQFILLKKVGSSLKTTKELPTHIFHSFQNRQCPRSMRRPTRYRVCQRRVSPLPAGGKNQKYPNRLPINFWLSMRCKPFVGQEKMVAAKKPRVADNGKMHCFKNTMIVSAISGLLS